MSKQKQERMKPLFKHFIDRHGHYLGFFVIVEKKLGKKEHMLPHRFVECFICKPYFPRRGVLKSGPIRGKMPSEEFDVYDNGINENVSNFLAVKRGRSSDC